MSRISDPIAARFSEGVVTPQDDLPPSPTIRVSTNFKTGSAASSATEAVPSLDAHAKTEDFFVHLPSSAISPPKGHPKRHKLKRSDCTPWAETHLKEEDKRGEKLE
ncbi:unnamed protein product [Protopolystoma xenopodis]|uniref:Uncharacterized protein n=1 Tax=Protopolystoma xenopodis TaxID=117903 RepID=A0A3S5ATZ9_9PLAT|nr:unnamed protein product [Protopolystoma xenopodis]